MLTQEDRLAIARIEGAGGVHASLIAAIHAAASSNDYSAVYRIGQDADRVLRLRSREIAALKVRVDVARDVRTAR